MSLLDTINAAKDAKEPQAQPDGQYKLVISGAKRALGKDSGKERLDVYFKIDNPTESPAQLVKIMLFDSDGLDEDQAERRKLEWRRFLEAFEITEKTIAACLGATFEEDDFSPLYGSTSWAVLSEKDEGEYGVKNEVTRFVSQSQPEATKQEWACLIVRPFF